MKILGTGLTGLVGSRFVELLEKAYDFEYISHSVNILDKSSVIDFIASSSAQLVIHLAAKTHVDGCELDKEKDKQILSLGSEIEKEDAWIKEQTAWGINVFGTQNIVEACKRTNKKIVYISTDFVFNGQKKSYDEEDTPDPVNWYAKTKYEGEKIVQHSGLDYLIVRPAYPYRSYFERTDIVRGILDKLRRGEKIKMVTDHIMKPTFIDDLVNALNILISTNQNGIFHIVGSQSITPYDLAVKIAKEFELDETLVSKITRREYFLGKASRPFCLNLKNDKIGRLGIEMSTFDQGLREVRKQMKTIKI